MISLVQKSSGKFILRLSPELHLSLARKAKKQGLSLNKLCTKLLEDSIQNSDHWIPLSLLNEVQKTFGNQLLSILAFGSRARSTNTTASDLDLLIVLKSERSIERKLYFEWDEMIEGSLIENAELYSPQFVNLPTSQKDAGSLWLEVALDGIIIYEKGSQVSQFLSKLKAEIAAGSFERKLTHGQPYWIRKDS